MFTTTLGEQLRFMQQGGVLTTTDAGDVFSGGVNQDGTFWCGGFDESVGSTWYLRFDGMFAAVASDSQPTSLQTTTVGTVTG